MLDTGCAPVVVAVPDRQDSLAHAAHDSWSLMCCGPVLGQSSGSQARPGVQVGLPVISSHFVALPSASIIPASNLSYLNTPERGAQSKVGAVFRISK